MAGAFRRSELAALTTDDNATAHYATLANRRYRCSLRSGASEITAPVYS
jgi:hypothetical protein